MQPSGARLVASPPAGAAHDLMTKLPMLMASAGVAPKIKVLYVSDYVAPARRLYLTSHLKRELSNLMPGYEVQMAMADGPFEDDDGVASHFGRDALSAQTQSKQVAALKVDLRVSIVKLARHAVMHQPRIIFGEGQGAIVAAGYAKPLCLERVLASRNVQPVELFELAQSWGNVAAVVLHEPRFSKKG